VLLENARYHPTFANCQAAINEILDGIPTTHAEKLCGVKLGREQLFTNRVLFHSRVPVSLLAGRSGLCDDVCRQLGQAQLRGPHSGLLRLAPRLVQPHQPLARRDEIICGLVGN
jgi:hypothetical protein